MSDIGICLGGFVCNCPDILAGVLLYGKRIPLGSKCSHPCLVDFVWCVRFYVILLVDF